MASHISANGYQFFGKDCHTRLDKDRDIDKEAEILAQTLSKVKLPVWEISQANIKKGNKKRIRTKHAVKQTKTSRSPKW